MTKNVGKPSPHWALFQRYDIMDWEQPDRVYLRRWRIVQTPWFGILLHKILLPDGDRDVHDHPWAFIPIILRGGYVEEWCESEQNARHWSAFPLLWPRGARRRVRRARIMRLGEFHRIRTLDRVPTWTLCLVGPRHGSWGFMTPTGFVDWKDYGEED